LAVSFDVAADAYDRFTGRYPARLAPAFVDLAGVQTGQRALGRRMWPRSHDGRAGTGVWAGRARKLQRDEDDESGLPGARLGHLIDLFHAAGVTNVSEVVATLRLHRSASFDEWWDPFTFGVGPAGAYARSLGHTELSALRASVCRQLLPESPSTLTAVSWAARAVAIRS
jgi:hypothetical protein